jgi:AbrB family looped-hinge helix DNA binding protein
MKISSKNQVSIPKKILEGLNLKSGDEIDFEIDGNTARLVPIKTIKIPRDQEWYWTPGWQEKEKEADQELTTGKYKDFDKLEELLKDLHG